MRKEHQKKLKRSIIFIIYLILCLSFFTETANAEEKTSIIDVYPKSVIGGQNFSISVYDPSIKNATPYLVNVTILFNDNFYKITEYHENGELILIAPSVLTQTTVDINAYKEGYIESNTTIIIIPSEPTESYQLVITMSTYSINAYEEFTVLVTDEYANPIKDVTVGIQGYSSEGSVANSDENGYADLIAPNKDEIIIIAQKQDYNDSIKNLWINTKPGLIDVILRDSNTPIFGALVVLIIVILFVSKKYKKEPLSNKKISKSFLNNNLGNKKKVLYYRAELNAQSERPINDKNLKSNLKKEEKKIQRVQETDHKKEIHFQKQEIKHNNNQDLTFKKSWFNETNDLQNKIGQTNETSLKNNKNNWFEGKEDIYKKIEKKLKERDKK
jgi:hypothetical protein